jgi:hypothetical protein
MLLLISYTISGHLGFGLARGFLQFVALTVSLFFYGTIKALHYVYRCQ